MEAPTPSAPSQCLVCQVTSRDVPLITLEYRGAPLWICPQHMPVLIHDPAKLAGLIEGAESMRPADHHD